MVAAADAWVRVSVFCSQVWHRAAPKTRRSISGRTSLELLCNWCTAVDTFRKCEILSQIVD